MVRNSGVGSGGPQTSALLFAKMLRGHALALGGHIACPQPERGGSRINGVGRLAWRPEDGRLPKARGFFRSEHLGYLVFYSAWGRTVHRTSTVCILKHQRFPEWSWRSFRRNWWRTSGEVSKEIFELLLLGKIVRSIFHQNSTANFTNKLHYEVLGCAGPYILGAL